MLIADVKRMLKLMPLVHSGKLQLGTALSCVVLLTLMAAIGREPVMFFSVSLVAAMDVMLLVNVMLQAEFSGIARSSAHRKNLMTNALPVISFFIVTAGYLLLAGCVIFASRYFPDSVDQALFALTLYYLALALLYTTGACSQYKTQGLTTAIYMVIFLGGMGMLVVPVFANLFHGGSFVYAFPAVPPVVSLLTGIFGSAVIALIVHIIQRLAYRLSINQKYLDKLE